MQPDATRVLPTVRCCKPQGLHDVQMVVMKLVCLTRSNARRKVASSVKLMPLYSKKRYRSAKRRRRGGRVWQLLFQLPS